jgi:hypothetical protein
MVLHRQEIEVEEGRLQLDSARDIQTLSSFKFMSIFPTSTRQKHVLRNKLGHKYGNCCSMANY